MENITLKIKGMMCSGCENRVQNALKTIEGVEEVVANHKDGTVSITLNKPIDKTIIKNKIEDLDYEVL